MFERERRDRPLFTLVVVGGATLDATHVLCRKHPLEEFLVETEFNLVFTNRLEKPLLLLLVLVLEVLDFLEGATVLLPQQRVYLTLIINFFL